jgi:hypothetical protein
MDDESLRERVDYMYIAPERMMNKPLLSVSPPPACGGHGPMNSTSPSQLKHQVTVFVRELNRS